MGKASWFDAFPSILQAATLCRGLKLWRFFPLVLVDIGGIPSAENREICASATHAILLAGDMERLPEWRAFCEDLGISVVAEIHSDYHGTTDAVPILGSDGVYRGSVHHLERGEPAHERPTVRALAELLVRMVTDEK